MFKFFEGINPFFIFFLSLFFWSGGVGAIGVKGKKIEWHYSPWNVSDWSSFHLSSLKHRETNKMPMHISCSCLGPTQGFRWLYHKVLVINFLDVIQKKRNLRNILMGAFFWIFSLRLSSLIWNVPFLAMIGYCYV